MHNTYNGIVLTDGNRSQVSGPLYKPGMNGRTVEELERFPRHGILWVENLDECCGEIIPFLHMADGVVTTSDHLPETIADLAAERGIPVIGGLDLNQILELEPVLLEPRTGLVKDIGYSYYCCK